MSKEVFILGAGFSKAVHSDMPLLNELTSLIKSKIEEDQAFKALYDKYIGNKFDDFEELLTYLYQNLPWKTEVMQHIHYAVYVRITELIVEILNEMQKNLSNRIDEDLKEPLKDFLNRLHYNRDNITVITFNYDTILEELIHRFVKLGPYSPHRSIDFYDLYHYLPIISAANRGGEVFMRSGIDYRLGNAIATVKLLKLHGSINWYYSGSKNSKGETIYYKKDHIMGERYESEKNIQDLVPLIIPPVLDKSAFMEISSIKIQWEMVRWALNEADKIYIIGYSLPLTDMAVKFLLKTTIRREAEVIPVNPNPGVAYNLKEILNEQVNISEDFVEEGNYEIVKKFVIFYIDSHRGRNV